MTSALELPRWSGRSMSSLRPLMTTIRTSSARLIPKGFYTRPLDGPRPKEKKGGKSYGDVWFVATYKPKAGQKGGQPLKAGWFLVIPVPFYVKGDQPGFSGWANKDKPSFMRSRV